MLDGYPVGPSRHTAGFIDQRSQIWSIMSQAHSAAHLYQKRYQKLNRRCDGTLAQHGLKRFDVPRVVYRELTKGL